MDGVRSSARVNRRPVIDVHRRTQLPSPIGQVGIATAGPVHHRQRGVRALQLLRDAQHPDAVPRHLAAAVRTGSRACRDRQGCLSLLRDRRVLLPAARRLDRRSAPRQVPHDPVAVARLLRGTRVPRRVRRQPHGLLHRAVPDRAGFGRHQTTRRVVRRRSVRSDEQTHREGRVRCVLLDHQFRVVLRLAAHAHLPAQLRAGGRVRYPRNPDVHRDRHLLGGTQEVRERSARPCRPAFVPARRAHGALGARRRTGTARAHHRRHRRGAGDRCVRDDGIARLRRLRMPCARLPAGVRWHRRVPATRSRERGTSAGSNRRRPCGAAHPHRVRAGDAVLVAVRPEGIDVDPAGGPDG